MSLYNPNDRRIARSINPDGTIYYSDPDSDDDADDLSISGEVAKKLLDQLESLRQLVSALSKSNEALVTEVAELRKEVQAFRAPAKYSDAVRRNLAPKQLQKVALVRRALREEKGADERAKNVILKAEGDVQECTEAFHRMMKKANVVAKCSRLSKEGARTRINCVSFPSVEEAKRFLKTFGESRAKERVPFSLRRDMSPSELTAYRRSWKEAIRRNNAAGKKLWAVRNFELVKLEVAEEWIVREKKTVAADPPSTPISQPSFPAPNAPPRPTVPAIKKK